MKKIILLLITAVCFFSCEKYELENPEGFAWSREGNVYKAISPEGVLFRLRYVKNYPEMELDFWGKTMKNHLENEGYTFLKEEEFKTPSSSGKLYEWGAPFGSEDYIYLTAIAVFKQEIVIAEAAGEYKLYKQYREALIKSLSTIKR